MDKKLISPDYLFEVSWEVCNKVGGIYTVLSTKALYMESQLKKHHIFVGPDFWTEAGENPDFTEDLFLYKSWKEQVASEGFRVRIGHWNVPGRPIAFLVDFKSFLPLQNSIMAKYWELFGVDSLNGTGDYKDSLVFGHVAGCIIESFYNYNLYSTDRIVAHFHEWQTGSGLLYIKAKKLPIATAFTTHATVVGRCVAGNNLPLYDYMSSYRGDDMARRFNVTARHSLEKRAAQNADVFTTVSDITAKECRQFLECEVDVTPNGFENSFTPATQEEFETKRTQARKCIVEVATAMCGDPVSNEDVLIGIGGRYEYRNKGIDVFLDSLAVVKNSGYDGKTIHAFIMIPSGHNGPDMLLKERLEGAGNEYTTQISHRLMNPQWDAISRRLRELGINNQASDKVKVYFIPSYLNGDDGIFNMKYYDLLIGMDASFFPSYYEPWGYTPLESLAFSVPTLTTDLAGFGQWVNDYYKKEHPGITVVKRNDSNYHEVVRAVTERIREIASLDEKQQREYMASAKDVANIALWENQVQFYKTAYSKALSKIVFSAGKVPANNEGKMLEYKKIQIDAPSWKSVMVTRHLPEDLSGLETLCKNLWWCWNEKAKSLFKSIDSQLWHESGHNPMVILDKVSLKRYNELAKDEVFLANLKEVIDEFEAYMAEKANRKDPSVAYFCMEYGLDTSLKIYSGGLGILAGDYLKESSDMNVNMVAVGLLYRYGYFTQMITAQGHQVAQYDPQDFLKIPAEPVLDENGEWKVTSVDLPGRTMYARIWKVAVGRTDLYLLDTDYEANIPEDRQVTHQLYGGDWENRLKQELLLGLGGIRALRTLGIDTQIYHCNEGHAAFTGLERLYEYIHNDNLEFPEALEVVRASSLFTTHTPVPAGHDAFNEDILRKYIGYFPSLLNISWETMMGLGKIDGSNVNEKFSMSILAANISQNVNGVSMLHGKVSQQILANMYPGYLPEELHVSYVTNGVHYPTWTAKEWKSIHDKVFGDEFKTHHYDKNCFDGIYQISDEEVWSTRKELKKTLVDVIKERLSNPQFSSHYSPRQVVSIKKNLRDDVLTIGFARRFATYKRATLLFSDLDRLDKIVNNPERPVQFIFAGKAHPADGAGQDLIRQIIEISKQDRFIGKIIFVPGYDITLAKRLVQGVDVWLNNPTRPQEASGTSGEKAAMNGVMHFSVLDGWWVEGYQPGAGWALPLESTYDDNNYQNDLDSATIYSIIENEIAASYYDVDENGRSAEWISYIKNTIAKVASNFTTNRMMNDYVDQYYAPQSKRSEQLNANNFAVAREIASWKKMIRRNWKDVHVISYTQPETSYVLTNDSRMMSEVVIHLGEISAEDLGVEMLFTVSDKNGNLHIQEKCEFELVESKDGVATYRTSILPERTGMYQVATRIYPKNSLLPHRQDFSLVRWL